MPAILAIRNLTPQERAVMEALLRSPNPVSQRELMSRRLTGALLDRLTHHVNILEMNGESYRLGQSKARQATGKT